MKKVVVVILNFNGGDTTVKCITSLLNSKLDKDIAMEVVVVDNASVDGSVEKIREKFEKIILIENSENLGFTGGSNVGARYAIKNGADYVVFLNNDTIVDHSLIQELVKSVEKDGVGGIVPKIYFEKGYEFHKDRYKKEDMGRVIWYAGGEMDWDNLIGKNIGVDEVDDGQYDERRETNLATGCCFLVRTDVLKKVGIFDDKYFLYYEDADLTERIKGFGFRVFYEPKAFLWHKNAESSGGSGSNLQDYYISRNRLLFGMKYAPFRTKVSLVRESVRILKSGRTWQKKGVADYYLRKFGKGSFIINR